MFASQSDKYSGQEQKIPDRDGAVHTDAVEISGYNRTLSYGSVAGGSGGGSFHFGKFYRESDKLKHWAHSSLPTINVNKKYPRVKYV